MGFGPPQGDPEILRVLARARARGALVVRTARRWCRLRRCRTEPRSAHTPRDDRDSLPHALRDGPRLLRAPRDGSRRRRVQLSLSVSRRTHRIARFTRRRSRRVDSHEVARCAPFARASRRQPIAGYRTCNHDYRARVASRRQTHYLRERRLGYRCNGLGAGLRHAGRRFERDSRDLALARARHHHRGRQRRRNRSDLLAPAGCAGASARRGDRPLHQRGV